MLKFSYGGHGKKGVPGIKNFYWVTSQTSPGRASATVSRTSDPLAVAQTC